MLRVALFVGCAATHLVPEIKDSWIKTLRLIFEEFDVVGIDDCCGMPFLMSGDVERTKKRAEELLLRLNSYDIVITGCPSCYRMFSHFYREKLGLSPRFASYHVVSVLYNAIRDGKIKINKSVDLRITFHDSCELVRHMGIVEEPRQILKSIPNIEFVEMKQNRNLSTCCGGGGLMRMFFPKVSQEIAIKKVLEEILPLGVNAIITSCPFCMYILKDAVKALGNNESLRVMDISELVLLAAKRR